MKKIKLSFLLAMILCLFSESLPASADASESTLTLMVYMCGSNLESGSGEATLDLLEMAGAGYDPGHVNLLVMTGGTTEWFLGLPSDALCIYQPENGHLKMLHAFESMSMGSPGPLTALLDYGYELFPADHYALILWDHGGGPMEGLCWDECYSWDGLTMAELCQALGQSPAAARRLDWIGFDACLMAAAEVADLMSPYARYMIASQETEPGNGWDYSFLKDIHRDKDGAESGRRIIDAYFAESRGKDGKTLSCIDLDRIGELSGTMDAFFDGLKISEGNYARYSFAARHSKTYGKAVDRMGGYDLLDLRSLVFQLGNLNPGGAEKAAKALESAVVYSRNNDGISNGLSVYHPYGNKEDYVREWGVLYPQLRFSEGYTSYIGLFASYLFGSSGISWNDLSSLPTSEEDIVALPLTKEQINMLSSAQLDMFRWNESIQAYAPSGSTSGIKLQDETLFAVLPGKSLRVIDEAGQACGYAIPYHPVDESRIGIYVNLCRSGAETREEAVRIIPVDTSLERNSGKAISFSKENANETSQNSVASYESETVPRADPEKVSLSEAYALQTQGTMTMTPPVRPSEEIQIVSVPYDMAEELLAASATLSLSGMIPPEKQTAVITPVNLFEDYGTPGTVRYSGPSVALSSFKSISRESFDPSVTWIDLTGYSPGKPSESRDSDVLHLWLSCRADENGLLAVDQLWLYDSAAGYWHQGSMPDTALYDTAVFPVSWLKPVMDINGALHGSESWQAVMKDSACTVRGTWSLRFIRNEDPELCTAFCLTDLQNRQHESVPQFIR